ncbi:MAG: 3-keto-5-aminohexanoate cleavage protein [Oscillospiraceae bacterium]|jgi:3-keto-5-aminohexanoate cleavage enzyme|nr:3-keto-5-aminohexanoate cleavage protein [Oscillospiraceae bacterium]
MAGKRKIILTVAQTGNFQGKDKNPNLPEQASEIIQSAYDCYNAGASIVHIHARDKQPRDKYGNSSNDPKVFAEINSGIRAKCNIITQNSTAPATHPGSDADDGVVLLYDDSIRGALPEMCSLDTSLIDTVWMDLKFIYEWRRDWLIKQANRMKELGIKPEIEVFNAESIEDVFYHLYPAGCLEDPVSLTLVMGMDRISQGAISYTQRNHDFMIDLVRDCSAAVGARNVDWSTMAIAANQLPATVYGMLKGGGVRTGMEDNINYRYKELAVSNSQLVERMVKIIELMEYEVATPDEAREILNIKKR